MSYLVLFETMAVVTVTIDILEKARSSSSSSSSAVWIPPLEYRTAKIRPSIERTVHLDYDRSCGSETARDNISHRNVTTRARPWELKETVRCVFCRGKRCRRCGKNAFRLAIEPSMAGFHCNWITDEVLAMQRPADELFESINLMEQFKTNKITAVINLTEPVKHFNFSWRDMTAPTVSQTQNIVRVCLGEIACGGKVAVHCHAGFGRTGVVVACIVIARQGIVADEAVALVRRRRPGSVQTATQVAFVQEFEHHYAHQNCVYPYAGVDKSSIESIDTCRLKTIDMSVEDEMLCQLETDEHDHPDGQTSPTRHQQYSLLPRAIKITCNVLSKAACAQQAAMVGSILGGAVRSNVIEEDISNLQSLANNGRWEAWDVLKLHPPPGPSEEDDQRKRLTICSYLLLDWLESRLDGLFSASSISGLETLLLSSQLNASDVEVQPRWFCIGLQLDPERKVPSPVGSAAGPLVDRVDTSLRACMSRYRLLLLDVLTRLLSGIVAGSGGEADDLPGCPAVTFTVVRLAIACLPAKLRTDIRKLLVRGRELHLAKLQSLVSQGVLRYSAAPAPAKRCDGEQSEIEQDTIRVVDRLVVVMNVLHTLVACNWTYSRSPRGRRRPPEYY